MYDPNYIQEQIEDAQESMREVGMEECEDCHYFHDKKEMALIDGWYICQPCQNNEKVKKIFPRQMREEKTYLRMYKEYFKKK